MIDDLLDLSRIVSGKLKLDVGPCDLRPVVLMSLETVHPGALARQITIDVDVKCPSAPILGDPSRIQQVLWNLLSNAVKFTPKGGRVQLTVETAGDNVVITVSDTGEGIPANFLPHLFEPFRQGRDAPGGRTGGLGLGLSIARRLVELHGGTLTGESPGVGLGSSFTITLPLQAEPFRSGPGGSFPG